MGAEIKHFTLEQKDDNTYGWPWNEVVRKYLEAGYESENKQCELTIRDKKYQILRRDSITVFYDEKGDTLFDVTNDRLEKEYKSAIPDAEEDPENDGPVSPMGKAIEAIERGAFEAATSGDEEIEKFVMENGVAKTLISRAKEKLEKELNDAKDKNFADPVIKYLLKRCEEDDGLSSDVLQPHKTWAKCFTYIYEQARKQMDGNCAAVLDDVVYEWAEDYFHLDDKAIEEKKKKEEEKRKKQQKQDAEKRKQQISKQKPAKEKKPEKTPNAKPVKEVKKQAPKKNETEGQMSLFDLL